MNQSELEATTSSWCQAQEKACEQVMIDFSFSSDWLISGSIYFSQSQSLEMQNQNNCEITFNTQLKTTISKHVTGRMRPFKA